MPFATIMPYVPAIAGALLGGSSGGSSATQRQEIDPRVRQSVFGTGGLLDNVDALRNTQYSQGGLNQMQNAGLEMQRQNYMSPQYTQGFDSMRNMGLSLMGGGVASNPFTRGTASPNFTQSQNNTGSANYTPFQYSQNATLQAAQNPILQQQSTPAATPAATPNMNDINAAIEDYLRQHGINNFIDTSGPGGE